MLWTGYLSPDFALFIALAILRQQRETLLHESYDFSDILQVQYKYNGYFITVQSPSFLGTLGLGGARNSISRNTHGL